MSVLYSNVPFSFLLQMSPQELLTKGIRVHRAVQRQGEFMVIYPQTLTATVCCGYNISESIRFATLDWIATGYQMSQVGDQQMSAEVTGSACKSQRY